MAVRLDDVYWFSAYVCDTYTSERSPSMCVGIWGNVYVPGYWFRAYDYLRFHYGYLPLVTATHGWDVSGLCDYVLHSAIDGWFCAAFLFAIFVAVLCAIL